MERLSLIEIKITAKNAICTMSDDEGPNNDADMDRFRILLDFYNGVKDGEPVLIAQDQVLWFWETPGELTVYKGYNWKIDQSKTVRFADGGKYDFNKSKLVIKVWAREYDQSSANEEGNATLILTGKDMSGDKTIDVRSSDFAFTVNFNISQVEMISQSENSNTSAQNHGELFLLDKYPNVYKALLDQGWKVVAGDWSALKNVQASGAVHCVDGRKSATDTNPGRMFGPKVQGGVLGIVALARDITDGDTEGIKKAVQKIQAAGYVASVHGDTHGPNPCPKPEDHPATNIAHDTHTAMNTAHDSHPVDKAEVVSADGCGFARIWFCGELTTLKNKKLDLFPENARKVVVAERGEFITLVGNHAETKVRLNFVKDTTYEPDETAFNLDVWFAKDMDIDAEALMGNAAETVDKLTKKSPVRSIEVVF
jgi:hypothetical protein